MSDDFDAYLRRDESVDGDAEVVVHGSVDGATRFVTLPVIVRARIRGGLKLNGKRQSITSGMFHQHAKFETVQGP